MTASALPYGEHIDEVKSRIIDVALQAFHEQGIRNVTMDDIAHRLSMSKRTLYQLFSDKEDLLLACVKKHIDEEDKRLAKVFEENHNVLGMLLAVFEMKMRQMDDTNAGFIEILMKYPRVLAFFEQNNKAREKEAVAFLEGGKAEGIFREGVNFYIVYNQLMRGFEQLVGSGLLERYSHREIFVNTLVPYVRGCATIEGIRVIDNFMEDMRRKLGD